MHCIKPGPAEEKPGGCVGGGGKAVAVRSESFSQSNPPPPPQLHFLPRTFLPLNAPVAKLTLNSHYKIGCLHSAYQFLVTLLQSTCSLFSGVGFWGAHFKGWVRGKPSMRSTCPKKFVLMDKVGC